MNFKKLYGWDTDTVSQIENVVRTTRDQLKNIIAGMRWRPRDGAYILHVTDRTGMTARVLAVSKDMKSKDKLRDRYIKFCEHFDLPYCCPDHSREYRGDDLLDDIFDSEDDDFGLGDDDFGLGDDDDDDDFGLTEDGDEDEDEDWGLDDDDDDFDLD